VPLLALVLAIAAIVLLMLGPLGWRAGWWHFRFAFSSLMPWAAYCGLAAMALAALAVVFGRRWIAGRQIAIGILAFAIGAAITYVPWHYDRLRGTVPPIHDITTDWQNPPQFSDGAGNGSRVDLRSESRQGRSDFGVNAARVRAYLAKLRESGDE